MLQVTDTGVTITLTGKPATQNNGMFWFSFALLIGAIAVAMAMSLLPEHLAIGALAILIVGSFVFNRLRSKQTKTDTSQISSGMLKVEKGRFIHNALGKQQQTQIVIETTDSVSVNGVRLLVKDNTGRIKCQVTGFDSPKEAQVMQAVLQGQQFGKRNANIRMQSN